VSVTSSSVCLIIFSLVNKLSFFLRVLLSEIVVNEALLSMMNVIEERLIVLKICDFTCFRLSDRDFLQSTVCRFYFYEDKDLAN